MPGLAKKTPLEAYIESPISNEPVAEEVIRRASESPELEFPSGLATPIAPYSHRSYASSISTRSVRSAFLSDTSSAFSQCPDAVMSGPPRRRRKRKHLKNPPHMLVREGTLKRHKEGSSAGIATGEGKAKFYCAFCHRLLSVKAWKRDEEIHKPQIQWICMPHGFRDATSSKCVPLRVRRARRRSCGIVSPPNCRMFRKVY
ncbi:hypothetical protein AOQ84DRAFT_39114 [Glonium stellatum]|uniref:Uncharacterized protein n=1 Tax=Glonium stellatum TaxID=574774 RepID=A0A8E2F1D2_9PEZI|nr:hypothetical protein AOQ84DRAFT_39114 [Glonium stellatum]